MGSERENIHPPFSFNLEDSSNSGVPAYVPIRKTRPYQVGEPYPNSSTSTAGQNRRIPMVESFRENAHSSKRVRPLNLLRGPAHNYRGTGTYSTSPANLVPIEPSYGRLRNAPYQAAQESRSIHLVNANAGIGSRSPQPLNLYSLGNTRHSQPLLRRRLAQAPTNHIIHGRPDGPKPKVMPREILHLEEFRNSPHDSESEDQSFSTARMNQTWNTDASSVDEEHQLSKFPDLVDDHGMQEWGSRDMDNRWASRPGELWKPSGHRIMGDVVSEHPRPSSEQKFPKVEIDEGSDELTPKPGKMFKALESQKPMSGGSDDAHSMAKSARLGDGEQYVSDMINDVRARNAQGGHTNDTNISGSSDVLTAHEPFLLAQHIRDLSTITETGLLPRNLPYQPSAIREQFYQAVFGMPDPPVLGPQEANHLVKYEGKIVTRHQLHRYLINEIDDLLAFMTSRASNGPEASLEANHSRLGRKGGTPLKGLAGTKTDSDQGQHRITPGGDAPKTSVVANHDMKGPEVPKLSTADHNVEQFRSLELQDNSDPGDQQNGPASFPVQESTQHILLPRGNQGPIHFPESAQDYRLYASNASYSNIHSAASASPPTVRGDGQTAPSAWVFQARQYGAYQSYGGWYPNPNAPAWPQCASHGSQHLPNSTPYVQPFIPGDRHVRPPAPHRLAPLYSQSPDLWQTAQSHQPARPRHDPQVEQYNRFGPSARNPLFSPHIALLPFRSGSDDMYPRQTGNASVRLRNLSKDHPPKYEAAIDEVNLPFGATTELAKGAEWGVLKVCNIPYDITASSLKTFLGSHAKIITPDLGPAVHIMMDRATGKTQDAFVEFFSVPDAKAWAQVVQSRSNSINKLGDRILDVQLSSQAELMGEIFPRAKSINWSGGASGKEVVAEAPRDIFDTGFKGFVTLEELQALVRHAEQPHRSIYTQKCPHRPYTTLISLLSKFPWQATTLYTLATRNAVFNATIVIIRLLVLQLRRTSSLSHGSAPGLTGTRTVLGSAGHSSNAYEMQYSGMNPAINAAFDSSYGTNYGGFNNPSQYSPNHRNTLGLDENLLRDVVMAALNAYGFSDKQRWEIVQAASPITGHQVFRLSPMARGWPFETLGRKRGFEEDVVEFYAYLFRRHPTIASATKVVLSSAQPSSGYPFGSLAPFYFYLDVENTTLAEMATHERKLLTAILKEVCAH